MTPKHPIAFRLSAEAIAIIERLAEGWATGRSGVVERALREAETRENRGRKKTLEKSEN